jgi:uncharacterized integral membrane protein (TIGR00698 family)
MIALRLYLSAATAGLARALPGVVLCALLGVVAMLIGAWYGSPILWALLLGVMIAASAPPGASFAAGIDGAGRNILRIGVALLGMQISADLLHVLDIATLLVLAASVLLVLILGFWLAPILRIERELAMVAAASVAICGASAAVAFALVLARPESRDRDLGCTVGAVSILSMLAMLIYPLLASALGLNPIATGIFLGGTIHEVPHAVAAGYAIDDVTGNVATMTKLTRVALLGPAVMLVSYAMAEGSAANRNSVPHVPLFLVAFVAFAVANMAGLIPQSVVHGAAWLSRFCLVVAMVAIGLKIQWRGVVAYGWRPMVFLTALSGALVGFITVFVMLHRHV